MTELFYEFKSFTVYNFDAGTSIFNGVGKIFVIGCLTETFYMVFFLENLLVAFFS